jgi:membrane protein
VLVSSAHLDSLRDHRNKCHGNFSLRAILQFASIDRLRRIRSFVLLIYRELVRTRAFVAAAALAFFFLLAVVPLLIVFSSLLGYLAVPSAFRQLLSVVGSLVPHEALVIVERALASFRAAPHGKLFSFGLLGYLWTASGGFVSTIEALDIAYDVSPRSWWRDHVQALLLTLTTGTLTIISLLAIVAGPGFIHFLQQLFQFPKSFVLIWPIVRLAITFLTFVSAIELLYFLGPNSSHSYRSTLPGAVIAVVGWFLGSTGLNLYLTHINNYSVAYGSLGAVICLMLWFYLIALSILIGAEVNAELIKLKLPDDRQTERYGKTSTPRAA